MMLRTKFTAFYNEHERATLKSQRAKEEALTWTQIIVLAIIIVAVVGLFSKVLLGLN